MASEIDALTLSIGIILALITTFCFNLAIVLQKKGLSEGMGLGYEIKIEEGLKSILKSFRGLIKNRFWLAGTVLGMLGWFPYIISIGMVGIIVTEPVMATGFIFFVVAANRILKEKVGILEYTAIGMLTISPVLIAYAGISDPYFDLVKFTPNLIIFLIITLTVSILCIFAARKVKNENVDGLLTMFGGAVLFALGGIFTNILAQAILQAKIQVSWFVVFEILFSIFWFLFTNVYAYLWVFLGLWGMVIFNVSSIPFYQGGFQKGKVLIMYPILDSIALLLPIMAGLFVFDQTFANMAYFIVAFIFIIIGTMILSKYQVAIERMYGPPQKELESFDKEDNINQISENASKI